MGRRVDGFRDRAVPTPRRTWTRGFRTPTCIPRRRPHFERENFYVGRRSKLTKLTEPLAQRFRQFCRFHFLSPRETSRAVFTSHRMKSSPRWSIGIEVASPPAVPARAPGMTMTPGDRSLMTLTSPATASLSTTGTVAWLGGAGLEALKVWTSGDGRHPPPDVVLSGQLKRGDGVVATSPQSSWRTPRRAPRRW